MLTKTFDFIRVSRRPPPCSMSAVLMTEKYTGDVRSVLAVATRQERNLRRRHHHQGDARGGTGQLQNPHNPHYERLWTSK